LGASKAANALTAPRPDWGLAAVAAGWVAKTAELVEAGERSGAGAPEVSNINGFLQVLDTPNSLSARAARWRAAGDVEGGFTSSFGLELRWALWVLESLPL
jgi:hypothetical protein